MISTDTNSNDGGAVLTPDGERIVFQSDRDGADIYIMKSDGQSQTNLTNNDRANYAPEWSPDGSSIVFESIVDGDPEIFIMNIDGSDQRNLSNHKGRDFTPTWSKDGSKIIFSSMRDGRVDLFVMNPDGSNQTKIMRCKKAKTFISVFSK